MSRLSFVLVVAGMILAAITPAVAPAVAQDHEWWILRPGAEKWLIDGDDMTLVKELNIVAEEGGPGQTDLHFRFFENNSYVGSAVFSISSDGDGDYWWHAWNNYEFKRTEDHTVLNPLCVVDDPLWVGKAWTDTIYNPLFDDDFIYEFECVAEEDLDLPAGTYHTFEIRYDVYVREGEFWHLNCVERKWHCDGVGLVQFVLAACDTWAEGEWELTSVFIPPDPVAVPTPSSPLFAVRNHPNPFNPQTTITFTLAKPQCAQIAVYDLSGHRLNVLADRSYTAGRHSVMWNGEDANGCDVPSGTYVVQLSADSGVQMKKVMLIR